MKNINEQLRQNENISEEQFVFLEAIRTEKIVSVYYELRLILYLGIMLFTGGIGYFAYQNMGDIGHLIMMALIAIACVFGGYFIQRTTKPYSNIRVDVELVYFDFLLTLEAILIITLFTYVQVYFDLVELLINWTSFLSAAILFFMAYRYDNRALLSMGITAFAAAVGVSISTIDWATGDWFASRDLYVTNMLLGAGLAVLGHFSFVKDVKKHFKFTYQNFGLLLYFIGGITAIFDSEHSMLFALLVILSASALAYYSWKQKAFLFFLYSNIAGYIALTYILFEALIGGSTILMIYYFPVSCIGYILFMVMNRKHFAQ